MPPTPETGDERARSRDQLKRRASAGIFVIATRGVVILVFGFFGSVVLTHLLTPHDFGTVAIGLSIITVASLLSDGGVGVGLIRREQPPERAELAALAALQLAATACLALAVALAAVPFGRAGWVTALMVSSMPLIALQLPGRIVLERSLEYRPLAIVEVGQVVAYYVGATALVAAGLGVWGLAAATLVRAAVGTSLMARVSPVGLVRPRFSWQLVRPLAGFGIRFQAATATFLARDQGLNGSIALIAGISTLGLWNLAARLIDLPYLLLSTLWRVSFPAMAQLVASKEDPGPVIERTIGIAAVGTCIVLVGLGASSPGLIPGLFGERWRGAADVLPGACIGLGIGGSISVATQGYLYAVGDAAAVLRAVLVMTVTLFAVTLPLLPIFGLSAVGLGWLAAGITEGWMLGRGTRRWIDVDLVGPLFPPVAAGIVAGALGWSVARFLGSDLASGLGGGVLAVACYLLGLFVLRRKLLYDTARFVQTSVRAAASNER